MSKVRLSVLDRLEILEADIDKLLADNVALKAENKTLKERLERLENPTPDNLMMGFLQSAK
ncbi:hypothetical protein [Streptococcus sp. sy010]|uniref:hypothetical protein n=1 Tax=Streptococcus sp. sy010 TaxID=2600148 RepID=UPI0011B72653|nr:hypothetical protein [Streptococcus sp. sy010]TWT16427.1 hypothetical protein FRX51_00500 [Streptococcus sp. sy010]